MFDGVEGVRRDIACSAGVFWLFSELLRDICGRHRRHLEFSKQRKVGEKKKFLPRGWSIGERKWGRGKSSGLFLPAPSLPTFAEIKHDGSATYRHFITLTCAP